VWLTSLIGIVLLYFAYAYLKSLKTCNCVNSTYTTRLKNLEAVFIVINSIFFLFAIFGSLHILGALEKIKNHLLKLIMLGGISMLLIYSYFVYTGYKFWHTMQDNCKCADGWQKYYIYLQTIVLFLIILLTVIFTGFLSFKKVPVGLIANAALSKALATGTATATATAAAADGTTANGATASSAKRTRRSSKRSSKRKSKA
jgi:hypothetical protein